MIGWSFDIYRKKWRPRKPAEESSSKGGCVASWRADIGGSRWLNDLEEQQKAICLIPGRYPGIYTAQAKDILPLLGDKPPCVKNQYEWVGNELKSQPDLFKAESIMRSCNPDEWLIVKIWDLS